MGEINEILKKRNADREPKTTFVVHLDWFDVISELTFEQAGMLMFNWYYWNLGEDDKIMTEDQAVRGLTKLCLRKFRDTTQKWVDTCNKRQKNGKHGDSPSVPSDTDEEEEEDTDDSDNTETVATVANEPDKPITKSDITEEMIKADKDFMHVWTTWNDEEYRGDKKKCFLFWRNEMSERGKGIARCLVKKDTRYHCIKGREVFYVIDFLYACNYTACDTPTEKFPKKLYVKYDDEDKGTYLVHMAKRDKDGTFHVSYDKDDEEDNAEGITDEQQDGRDETTDNSSDAVVTDTGNVEDVPQEAEPKSENANTNAQDDKVRKEIESITLGEMENDKDFTYVWNNWGDAKYRSSDKRKSFLLWKNLNPRGKELASAFIDDNTRYIAKNKKSGNKIILTFDLFLSACFFTAEGNPVGEIPENLLGKDKGETYPIVCVKRDKTGTFPSI